MADATWETTSFEPGVYVLIDDVMTGVRKLVRVTESGNGYFDLDDADATPFPLYKTLNPVEAGNILSWGLYLVDHEPQHADAFMSLCDRLVNSGADVLTYTRAAHWAFGTRAFDFDKALAEGRSQTAAIMAGRADMDQLIKSGGGTA